jgi:hypothetical protein
MYADISNVNALEEITKGRDHSEDLDVDGRTILKWYSGNRMDSTGSV